MSLPNLPAKDNYRREVRTEWGGINLNENAGDGELIEALNMSSREYPLLATEWIKQVGYPEERPLISPYLYEGKLGHIKVNTLTPSSADCKLYDPTTGGGYKQLNLSPNDVIKYRVVLAQLLGKLYVFPSKQVYDFSTHTISDMEATWTGSATFDNGTYGGVSAEANTIKGTGIGASFHVGDAVTISGCSTHTNNNKSVIIREVSENELRFYENSFDLDTEHRYTVDGTLAAGTYYFLMGAAYNFTLGSDLSTGATITFGEHAYNDGPGFIIDLGGVSYSTAATLGISGTYLEYYLAGVAYTESSDVTITRAVPDMDFVCVNENRMWGCKGDTIYASKLGDPLNWNVSDGLSTDSWTAETGTPGDFTGCCSFQGYPTFFKENAVFKVLGDEPKNFTLRRQNIVGVAKGGNLSIVEIRGQLYYVSNIGVVAWNGGDYPSIISHALGSSVGSLIESGNYATAGTDGVRYFVELPHTGYQEFSWGTVWGTNPRQFVYDTRFGTWHETDWLGNGYYLPEFAYDGYYAYMLGHSWDSVHEKDLTTTYILSGPAVANKGDTLDWKVTFADSTRAYKTALTGSESKKGVLRLLIRCRLAGSMKVWIAYDGGDFEEAAEFSEMAKTSKVVPLILRRCDFWQLRLTGTGDAVIYSIAVERYGGEWQQA